MGKQDWFLCIFVAVAQALVAMQCAGSEDSWGRWTIYQEWPFSAEQAKRRQRETAKALGVSIEKTISLPNGKAMVFCLIPAGRFVMGTPMPVTDMVMLETNIYKGKVLLGIGCFLFGVPFLFLLFRALKNRQPFQLTLRMLLFLCLALSLCILGGTRSRQGEIMKTDAKRALMRRDGCGKHAAPAHQVIISRPFYLSKYEVTQEEYMSVMDTNPSHFTDQPNYPVDSVFWERAQSFCDRINKGCRLPSEAEWEYACRGGTQTEYCSGDGVKALKQVGWCSYDGMSGSAGGPKSVGLFIGNAWGLHDMHGNVEEWCGDDWHASYNGAPADGSMWVNSPRNGGPVIRGGSSFNGPESCSSAMRDSLPVDCTTYFTGFRVLLDFL